MCIRPGTMMIACKTGITLENADGKTERTIPFTTIEGIRIEYRYKGFPRVFDHRVPVRAEFRLTDGTAVIFSADRIVNIDWELIHRLHQHCKYHRHEEGAF